MAAKVPTTCFQSIVPHCTSSSQALASSPTTIIRSRRCAAAGALVLRSPLFCSPSTQLQKSRNRRWVCRASLDGFSDEEFSRKIQELALKFQLAGDDSVDSESDFISDFMNNSSKSSQINHSSVNFVQNHQTHFRNSELVESRSPWPEIHRSPEEDIDPASIERKANSVDLPLSLRIIKRKMKLDLREAGDSAYCAVKKAFSSMVFIIGELQSFTLQMREALYFEDLHLILARVQKEMHASFVWLFQQVFSQTPTLMVYVMILLANFTVHSMSCHAAVAPPPASHAVMTESVSEDHTRIPKFDSSSIKSFAASVGGSSGGGGKFRPIASGTDGEGSSDQYSTLFPDGVFRFSSFVTAAEPEAVVISDEEVDLWNSIVEEASNLQAILRDEALDHDTVRRFVSPVTAKIDSDDYTDYFKTELVYQRALSQEPNNSLLLANYAQFLFLVAHDYDRAEEYFKRAIKVSPPDAEALGKYATFLWKARNQTWAAEETYLEAINADPSNSHYAGNYAHFLWNTGGDDTCFPISEGDVQNF